MIRTLFATLVALVLMLPAAYAQDGPLRRAGRALDNAGKDIRGRVETEVARGQSSAQERDILARVSRRIEWDKRLVGSTLQLEVRPGETVVLRGSVLNAAAKRQAVELATNTVGVASVVDELAIVKEVKVIESTTTGRVIEVSPGTTVIESTPAKRVIEVTPVEKKAVVTP